MMAYNTSLLRTVYWTVLYAPDVVGDKGPYTPANLQDIRVRISRNVRESGPYTCPIGVAEGEFVYFTGSNAVDQADSSVPAETPAIGLIVNKPTTTSCLLLHEGEPAIFSSLTPGSIYYLSTVGTITATAPTTPGEVVQRIGVAVNATTLLLTLGEETLL